MTAIVTKMVSNIISTSSGPQAATIRVATNAALNSMIAENDALPYSGLDELRQTIKIPFCPSLVFFFGRSQIDSQLCGITVLLHKY